MKKDAYTEHCCIKHGCKYGDKNCTVTTGKLMQSFFCEDCEEEQELVLTYPMEIDIMNKQQNKEAVEKYKQLWEQTEAQKELIEDLVYSVAERVSAANNKSGRCADLIDREDFDELIQFDGDTVEVPWSINFFDESEHDCIRFPVGFLYNEDELLAYEKAAEDKAAKIADDEKQLKIEKKQKLIEKLQREIAEDS